MVGSKFGKLTVDSFSKTHKRQKFWNCLCECGSFTERSTGQLNRGLKLGMIQSCRTCAQRSNKSKDLGKSSWRINYNNYIAGAKRRGLSFDISIEEFKKICSEDCHYCGASPTKHNRYIREDGNLVSKISKFTADRSWVAWNGIDRKRNHDGYEMDNILPCCTRCNIMKGTQDYHEFIANCGSIYLYRKFQK